MFLAFLGGKVDFFWNINLLGDEMKCRMGICCISGSFEHCLVINTAVIIGRIYKSSFHRLREKRLNFYILSSFLSN